ncbi:MAG TPA: hypothetical protein VKT80_12520, partial [Chloroflexota bacterium]|nr:hypothetical protein [Chloroflexota bacterium]
MARQIGELADDAYRGRLITYRGPDFVGEVGEVGPGEWLENNQQGSNRFRTASDTGTEIVLQKVGNVIQFKLDLAARKTFWRRGTQDAWKYNYDIAQVLGDNSAAPAAGLYNRIVFRRHEGSITDFGSARRVGSDRWIELHREAVNRYQQVSETSSELVLYNPGNNVQFKLDIAARKCFWRHGTSEGWKPNYDIVEVEASNPATERSGASGGVPAVAFSAFPQAHVETNVLATLMGELGCGFENRDWPDLQSL